MTTFSSVGPPPTVRGFATMPVHSIAELSLKRMTAVFFLETTPSPSGEESTIHQNQPLLCPSTWGQSTRRKSAQEVGLQHLKLKVPTERYWNVLCTFRHLRRRYLHVWKDHGSFPPDGPARPLGPPGSEDARDHGALLQCLLRPGLRVPRLHRRLFRTTVLQAGQVWPLSPLSNFISVYFSRMLGHYKCVNSWSCPVRYFWKTGIALYWTLPRCPRNLREAIQYRQENRLKLSYWSYLKLDRNTQGRGDTLNKRDGTSYYEKICLRGDRAVAGCRVSYLHCYTVQRPLMLSLQTLYFTININMLFIFVP